VSLQAGACEEARHKYMVQRQCRCAPGLQGPYASAEECDARNRQVTQMPAACCVFEATAGTGALASAELDAAAGLALPRARHWASPWQSAQVLHQHLPMSEKAVSSRSHT
jgi:hypothetical protein